MQLTLNVKQINKYRRIKQRNWFVYSTLVNYKLKVDGVWPKLVYFKKSIEHAKDICWASDVDVKILNKI